MISDTRLREGQPKLDDQADSKTTLQDQQVPISHERCPGGVYGVMVDQWPSSLHSRPGSRTYSAHGYTCGMLQWNESSKMGVVHRTADPRVGAKEV